MKSPSKLATLTAFVAAAVWAQGRQSASSYSFMLDPKAEVTERRCQYVPVVSERDLSKPYRIETVNAVTKDYGPGGDWRSKHYKGDVEIVAWPNAGNFTSVYEFALIAVNNGKRMNRSGELWSWFDKIFSRFVDLSKSDIKDMRASFKSAVKQNRRIGNKLQVEKIASREEFQKRCIEEQAHRDIKINALVPGQN